jgi:hypothetical protein
MIVQISQPGLTAEFNFKLFGPSPANFIERVKTDQYGPALQSAHQVTQAGQFIQHIRALSKAFGFALDQMQAADPDLTEIETEIIEQKQSLDFSGKLFRRLLLNIS